MRKLLLLSVLALLTAGAAGCNCMRGACGTGLCSGGMFGMGREAAYPAAAACCDPCAGAVPVEQ